jgi:prepilin-type processing-associated H-X9-DG protein
MYWNCSLEETDAPERNLYEPRGSIGSSGIRKILTQIIARHGDFPAADAPREIEGETLPGAINIAFVDGHAENVPLENLWTLYWHRNWDPARVTAPHPAPR